MRPRGRGLDEWFRVVKLEMERFLPYTVTMGRNKERGGDFK